MDNKNIAKVKNKLTLIFTIIVFVIILFLGTVFFSFKYFRESNIEKNNFKNIVKNIEKRKNGLSDFLKISNTLKFDLNNRKPLFGKDKTAFYEGNINERGFMNYIIYNENSIISYNIKENISESFLSYIISDNYFENIKQKDGFILKNIKTKAGFLVLFKKLRYSFIDFINDLFVFLIINLLFSFFFFIVGRKFVNKIFIPVEENIKNMKDFVHNAGHELKTPLSVIDSNIQIIKDVKKFEPEMIGEIKQETLKLNSLIDSLIKLSDIDNLEKAENINLKSIIKEILDDMKSNINKKDLSVVVKITKDIEIKASRNYLYIFLSNIIGNAIKYNKQKGKINISYKAGVLTIKDTGIGISKDKIIKIFDRFYKVDKSRNTKGFGIGLSLVKKIADIYKWKISVESEEKKGSSFKIKI